MKHLFVTGIKQAIFITAFSVITLGLFAQEESEAYVKAKKEIIETFGSFPSMFEVFPNFALPGAWQAFKELSGPGGSIDAKHRELIQLAVAAQIPCQYCTFFHTESAKAFGATEEEIQEAVAYGAQTRHWSMILQGNQVDLEKFKEEFQEMMKFMQEKTE